MNATNLPLLPEVLLGPYRVDQSARKLARKGGGTAARGTAPAVRC